MRPSRPGADSTVKFFWRWGMLHGVLTEGVGVFDIVRVLTSAPAKSKAGQGATCQRNGVISGVFNGA